VDTCCPCSSYGIPIGKPHREHLKDRSQISFPLEQTSSERHRPSWPACPSVGFMKSPHKWASLSAFKNLCAIFCEHVPTPACTSCFGRRRA
jgi:hypothetical protein